MFKKEKINTPEEGRINFMEKEGIDLDLTESIGRKGPFL